MKFHAYLLLLLILVCSMAEGEDDVRPKAAQSIGELQRQLEGILTQYHVPGVSVAIVKKSGPEWVAGVGLSDVSSHRPATEQTLFRIGSTSKAFASMSILKLVNEGRLSMTDPVRKLVPEIQFDNPWEATDPVRVVDLLEHTTGWNDMQLRDYAKDAANMSLREALDFNPGTRVSRWKPGTRMAYCNIGPAVAAYIVEKITGQRFEDYVQQNFFVPIGMRSATYFNPAEQPDNKSTPPAITSTSLYHPDGKTPYPYWHILVRPSGAISASATDMANYLLFYLNRGTVNGLVVLPAASVERMEKPTRTWGAQQGLQAGYGLGNYTDFFDGFEYHGHNGGVAGGITNLSYMADYGVGFFYSINSDNRAAFNAIGDAIRAYVVRNLTKPALPLARPMPEHIAAYAGWYQPDSTRVELTHFYERLLGLSLVKVDDNKLIVVGLGSSRIFVPVINNQFRLDTNPAASLALLTANPEGTFIQDQMNTMRRVPTWLVMSEITATIWVGLACASVLIYAPFWLLGRLFTKRRHPQELWLRLWPLIAMLSLIVQIIVLVATAMFGWGGDIFQSLGTLTVWSGTFFLASIVFAVASLGSGVALWRTKGNAIRRMVRWHACIVSAALLLFTAYLLYWGMIGVRTWA